MSQKELWDLYHQRGDHDQFRDKPSEFAKSTIREIRPGSRVLELGCGNGADANLFSNAGLEVVATDFSEAVIAKNKQAFPGVEFAVVDISRDLPFDDGSFEVVYANLSLHYFDEQTTSQVFNEIYRVLVREGRLFFRVKSTNNTYEIDGADEIAPNIFVKNGHLRHLFSVEYTNHVVGKKFTIDRSQELSGEAYGYEANFIECTARKDA